MKKLLTALLALLLSGLYVRAQYVSIPDTMFGHWLNLNGYSQCLQGNASSGWQLDTTCPAVVSDTIMDCSLFNISNLTGIRYFDNLRYLDCTYNLLTSFPTLPGNLRTLNCDYNQLTSLPVAPASLESIDAGYNQLTSLVALPPNLKELRISDNQLTTLSALPSSLFRLYAGTNQLSTLPTLPNNLQHLYVSDNVLTTLPALPANLQTLDCADNQLTSLPALPASLSTLICDNNQLTSLPTLPISLYALSCMSNNLTSLPELPDSLYTCSIGNNPSLTCLPDLKNVMVLNFLFTPIACAYNFGNQDDSLFISIPDITSLPQCMPNNSSGCPSACTGFQIDSFIVTDLGCSGYGGLSVLYSGGTPPYFLTFSGAGHHMFPGGGFVLTAPGPVGVSIMDSSLCYVSDSSYAYQASPISLSVSTTPGPSMDTVCVVATGGIPPYSTNVLGNTVPLPNGCFGLLSGTYSLTVTSDGACRTTFTNAVTADAGPDRAMCTGAGTTLVASGQGGTPPYTYTWSGGAASVANPSVNPVVNTTYHLTVTDSLGSTGTDSVTVFVRNGPNPRAHVHPVQPTSCFHSSDGNGCAVVTGGLPPYSYRWSTGSTQQCDNQLIEGIHFVTVTDSAGCTATARAVITDPSLLYVQTTTTGTTPDTICAIATGGGGQGFPYYTYHWGTGVNPPFNNACAELSSGTPTFTVTDNYGCYFTSSMQSILTVSAGEDPDIICLYDSISLGDNLLVFGGTPPYTYEWFDITANAPLCTCTNPIVSPNDLSLYRVLVTDSLGATAEDLVIIYVDVFTLDSLLTTSACVGMDNGTACVYTSGGAAPYTYAWSNGGSWNFSGCTDSLAPGVHSITVTDMLGCTATDTFSITSLPSPTATATTVVGPGLDTICVTTTGGTPPYTDSLVGNTMPLPNGCFGVISGGYSLTVTDVNGCSAFLTDNLLMADAGPDTTICRNTSVRLGGIPTAVNGTGPFSYAWAPTVGLSCNTCARPLASPTANTTYVLTITDAAGSVAHDSVTVTLHQAVVIDSIITTNTCAGSLTGSACAYVSGGLSPYIYQWNGTVTASCIYQRPAGTYPLTVTDSRGCFTSSSATIGAFLSTTIVINTYQGPSIDTVCVTITGGTPPFRDSIVGNTVPLPNGCFGVSSGGYSLTITDGNGCTSFHSSTGLLRADAGLDRTVCPGDSVLLGGFPVATGGTAPYTYSWSAGAGCTTCANPWAVAATTTRYTVTITDNAGATATDSVLVTTRDSVVIDSIANPTICNSSDGYIRFDGFCDVCPVSTIAYFYNGALQLARSISSPGGPHAYLTGLPAGTYTDIALLYGGTGCYFLYPGPYVLSAPASVNASATPTDVWCFSGNNGAIDVTVSGSGTYTYQWSDGSVTTQDRTGLLAGTYTVTATSSTGCSDTATATINEPTDITLISFTITDITCNGAGNGGACVQVTGGTPSGTAGYTYFWSSGTAVLPNCVTNLTTGIVTVSVVDGNGCTASFASSAAVQEPPVLTAQIIAANGGILPDTLTAVGGGGTPGYTYSWTTPQGMIVSNIPTFQLNLSASEGQYVLEVMDDNSCLAYDSIIVGCADECVWPGDANYDGIADNYDVLPIGIGFGTTGFARADQSTGWYAHIAQDWNDTLLAGTNYKHLDCDGNGTINSADTNAILQNFGSTHAKGFQKPWRLLEPTLHVELVPDTTHAGDTLYANLLLGDATLPMNNAYGLAFTVNYDVTVVDTTKTQVIFGDSWLGNSTDKISISKDLKALGQVKCGVTRIDRATRSGYGKIGQVNWIITTDNINGKDMLDYYAMHVWISDLVVIDELGNEILVNEGSDSTLVEFELVGIADMDLDTDDLKLQPNPADEEVTLLFNQKLLGAELKLLDVNGRILMRKTVTETSVVLPLGNLSNAIYFVQVTNQKGILTKRLVIARGR